MPRVATVEPAYAHAARADAHATALCPLLPSRVADLGNGGSAHTAHQCMHRVQAARLFALYAARTLYARRRNRGTGGRCMSACRRKTFAIPLIAANARFACRPCARVQGDTSDDACRRP